MAKFTKARVDFDQGFRVKSVTVDPSSGVEAIFFNGQEKKLLKNVKAKRITGPMPGVTVDPAIVPQDGDESPVCYLLNGQLVCW